MPFTIKFNIFVYPIYPRVSLPCGPLPCRGLRAGCGFWDILNFHRWLPHWHERPFVNIVQICIQCPLYWAHPIMSPFFKLFEYSLKSCPIYCTVDFFDACPNPLLPLRLQPGIIIAILFISSSTATLWRR